MSSNIIVEQDVRPRTNLRMISLVLVAVGIFVSGYLSYTKATSTATVCVESGVFNCEVVTNSAYSRFMGIPVAYLGLMMYIVVGTLLLFENRVPLLREYGPMLVFGVALFAWLFSMWLVYVQFFRLEALCPWCLTHEANMTILFAVSGFRLRNALE